MKDFILTLSIILFSLVVSDSALAKSPVSANITTELSVKYRFIRISPTTQDQNATHAKSEVVCEMEQKLSHAAGEIGSWKQESKALQHCDFNLDGEAVEAYPTISIFTFDKKASPTDFNFENESGGESLIVAYSLAKSKHNEGNAMFDLTYLPEQMINTQFIAYANFDRKTGVKNDGLQMQVLITKTVRSKPVSAKG